MYLSTEDWTSLPEPGKSASGSIAVCPFGLPVGAKPAADESVQDEADEKLAAGAGEEGDAGKQPHECGEGLPDQPVLPDGAGEEEEAADPAC